MLTIIGPGVPSAKTPARPITTEPTTICNEPISAEAAPATGPVAVGAGHEVVGSALGAAGSSFLFFASGAIIPVLPWIFGLSGLAAVLVALVLVFRPQGLFGQRAT